MNYQSNSILILLFVFFITGCLERTSESWEEDFKYQKITERPSLEVSYSDSSRTGFLITGETYDFEGLLTSPHTLLNEKGENLLWFEAEGPEGEKYSTRNSQDDSRINLYRRGPYFCEIHWFDLKLANDKGDELPLLGDLILYCYPEKMLAEIKWYRTGELSGGKLAVKGISEKSYSFKDFKNDTLQEFSFPLFGEEPPLPDSAFQTIVGEVPFRYDHRKGYYVVGTHTSGSFQKEFYETPNRYETATFRVTNNDKKRKIYICHESAIGGSIVEGGVVLDEDGKPMPLVVQVSKNFDGEKEEKFYNPRDTAFSETFFPLYLEPNETNTLTTLHLYQNWGRHMTKHWSSLGAWMDYFHSSTGMTETTCYVPFKFAGIGGVSIADMRAMSQETFWAGQPQHDNIAGHSFLSFFDGERWQHLKYISTIYRSTGPNWYDIQLNYISADSSIKVTADIWETPQADELRSFFDVKYEVLKPLKIDDAEANFRLLSITSAIQRLVYTKFACNGVPEMELDLTKRPFPVKGISLPKENAFVAEYGDQVRKRGSNAIIIRNFEGPNGIGPAATMQLGAYKERFSGDREADTRLLIVPDVETLELNTGDVFKIDGYWLPYGSLENAETPRNEIISYANDLPEVNVTKGSLISNLPLKIKAIDDEIQVTVRGGKDLIPLIVTGLSSWEMPRLWQKENDKWRLLSHARNSSHDGYQVFCDADGSYGAVFLVHSDLNEQELKVSLEKKAPEGSLLAIDVPEKNENEFVPDAITVKRTETDDAIKLRYPLLTSVNDEKLAKPGAWKQSEGNSLWYHSFNNGLESGGRVTPNNEDLDLEFWWQFHEDGIVLTEPQVIVDLGGSGFEDIEGENIWGLKENKWEKLKDTEEKNYDAIAVQSQDGKEIAALVWNNGQRVSFSESTIGIVLETPEFSQSRRYLVRGKLYLFEGDLESLALRIHRELTDL